MMGEPTGTIDPSVTSSSVTVPANGHGSSTDAFAVSISTIIWLTFTTSPGRTCQRRISASVSPSPTSGRAKARTSLMTSPSQYAIARSTASSTRSRSGRKCSSSRLAGYGTSYPVTRSTGDSSE